MEPEARAEIERNQSAILSLRDRVIAKQEGRSDLLRITFRHADPSIAASYLNELANALVAIQSTDVQMPGAQEFFQQQTKRLEEEAEIAAANLKDVLRRGVNLLGRRAAATAAQASERSFGIYLDHARDDRRAKRTEAGNRRSATGPATGITIEDR